MDIGPCIIKLGYVGVLDFATADEYCISEDCIGCGTCFENCPVDAIRRYGYEGCIA